MRELLKKSYHPYSLYEGNISCKLENANIFIALLKLASEYYRHRTVLQLVVFSLNPVVTVYLYSLLSLILHSSSERAICAVQTEMDHRCVEVSFRGLKLSALYETLTL